MSPAHSTLLRVSLHRAVTIVYDSQGCSINLYSAQNHQLCVIFRVIRWAVEHFT